MPKRTLNRPEPAGDVVCPNCSDANDALADFCAACGAPVGRFTTLDPLKAIYAEGWLFRKSASARIGPLVLVGMWAFLGSLLLATVGRLVTAPAGTPSTLVLAWAALGLILLLVLARVTRNFLRNRPGPGPHDPERRGGRWGTG